MVEDGGGVFLKSLGEGGIHPPTSVWAPSWKREERSYPSICTEHRPSNAQDEFILIQQTVEKLLTRAGEFGRTKKP